MHARQAVEGTSQVATVAASVENVTGKSLLFLQYHMLGNDFLELWDCRNGLTGKTVCTHRQPSHNVSTVLSILWHYNN